MLQDNLLLCALPQKERNDECTTYDTRSALDIKMGRVVDVRESQKNQV